VGVPVHHSALDNRGFSLVEMAIVVLVLGIVIAMSVGGFHRLNADQQLHDGARGVVSQLTLARTRAMATSSTQTVNFDNVSSPPRVYIIGSGGSRSWNLPPELSYATGSATTVNMTSDGRASASTYVVLRNKAGLLDTVSVESSGLVIAR
jgi:prepilin-type N-terminal cleavage/methylation domain-containing protein